MAVVRRVLHIIALVFTVGISVALIYLSRFWIWTAPWSNDGLLGIKDVSPYGDVLRRWLSGTWFRDFDIVIWGLAAIVLLSLLQWLRARVKS